VTVLLLLPACYVGIKKLLLFFNPARSVKTLGTAVWKTLCDCGRISPNTWVETEAHKSLYYVSLRLRNASVHDQNVFNSAMTEMLSPIENPRYLMIARRKYGGYRFRLSFACPSVIGRKAEYAEILAGHLRQTTERFVPVYTRSEEGRRLLLGCRKRSYITENEKAVNRRYKVTHWE